MLVLVQSPDNSTGSSGSSLKFEKSYDNVWSMNYCEASIYLKEGLNNNKFEYHPNCYEKLASYLIAHNSLVYTVDLVVCLVLLLLALFEKPTVDKYALPEGVSFLREKARFAQF